MTAELLAETPQILPVGLPEIAPWTLPDIRICAGITSHLREEAQEGAMRALFLDHQVELVQSMLVYTDVSKSERGVGWAAVFPTTTLKGRLPNHASIFTAERSAFVAFLEHIRNQPRTNYTVHSDSRSAIQALQDINTAQPLVQRGHRLLRRVSSGCSSGIVFC